MKKKLYAFAALCLLSIMMNTATAQSWQWGKRAGSDFDETGPGGGNYENTIDMATDYNGNVYSLCRTYGKVYAGPVINLDVDGNSKTSYGSSDILLTSFNCKGEYRWSKVIGTYNVGDAGIALRTDELGGVYVLGKYFAYDVFTPPPNLYVDTDTILNVDNRSIFLVKYDTAGNYQWIRSPEPDTIASVTGRTPVVLSSTAVEMAINGENEVCVLAYLRKGAFEGGAYVVSDPELTYHMLIYDRFGVFKRGYKMDMACTGGFNNAYYSMKMSIDKKTNKFYFAGGLAKGIPSYTDTLTLGGSFLTTSCYLSRFDDNGKMEWLKVNTGGPSKAVYILTRPLIDKFSNVYVAGIGTPGDDFNGYTFTNSITPTTYSTFLMKLDSSGKRIWTKSSNNQYPMPGGNGISISGNTVGFRGMFVGKLQWGTYNFVWLTGGTYIPYFLRFNSITGEMFGADTIAAKIEGNGTNPDKNFLSVDRFSNFYLGGGYKSDNDMVVAGNTLVSAGGKSDIYLVKHGRNNCDCIVAPTAGFSVATPAGSLSSTFTFGGTSPSDSVVWYFGDTSESRASTPTHTFKTKGVYNVCVVVYNRCGSDVYCKGVPVGVTNSILEATVGNVKIYPNPTQDILHIEGAAIGSIMALYDMQGRVLKSEELQSSTPQIDMSQLPKGNYLLRIISPAGEVGSAKVLKE